MSDWGSSFSGEVASWPPATKGRRRAATEQILANRIRGVGSGGGLEAIGLGSGTGNRFQDSVVAVLRCIVLYPCGENPFLGSPDEPPETGAFPSRQRTDGSVRRAEGPGDHPRCRLPF